MPRNWEYEAGVVWPMLVQAAASNSTIFYDQIAKIINTNPLSVGRALGPIQDYCMDHRLPPLTSIVISKATSEPGGGFIAWDIQNLPAAHQAVYNFNWSSLVNPYGGLRSNDTTDSLAQDLIKNTTSASQVFAKVPVRGIAQIVFRKALLKLYRGQCAFCGITFEDVLDASHIKPWHECSNQEKLDVRNGLLLCASHHRLFDAGLITINKSYQVYYFDASMSKGSYSQFDQTMTVNLHSKNAFLPSQQQYRPAECYLDRHYILQEWDDLV